MTSMAKRGGGAILATGGLAMALAWACPIPSARASDTLDPAGARFLDFAKPDNGASFLKPEFMESGGNPGELRPARLISADNDAGTTRVRFDAVGTEITLPMGWHAVEDWERGLAFSRDRRVRLIVWRVDFAFEGVKDAEHYVLTKIGSIRARRPSVSTQARRLGDGSYLIVYENVPPSRGDSEKRVVFDVVVPRSTDAQHGTLLTLGVPASEAGQGLRLLALIRESTKSN